MRLLAIIVACLCALPAGASTLSFTAKIKGDASVGFSRAFVDGPDGSEPFDIDSYSPEELGFGNTYIYGLGSGKVRGTLSIASTEGGGYFVECYFNDLVWNACGQSTAVAETTAGTKIEFVEGGYIQQIVINPLTKRGGNALYNYEDDCTPSGVLPDGRSWFVNDGIFASIPMSYHIVGSGVTEVPLPAGGVLLASGLLGLALKRKRT